MRREGFTLTELLIAASILVVVLMIVTTYLSTEAAATRVAQARSEVQDRARLVSQIVQQDLQLAGASRYVDTTSSTPKTVDLGFTSCSSANLCVTASNSGTTDGVSMRYITSLRTSAEACRSVSYAFDGTTLRRSDVACGATAALSDLATNILALNLVYVCSDGRVLDSAACPTSPVPNQAYPRSARLSVVAMSEETTRNSTATNYSITLADGSTTTVTCPAQRLCSALSQEITLPNLR